MLRLQCKTFILLTYILKAELILRQACRRINFAFRIYASKVNVLHCRRSIINSATLLHTSSTQSEQHWNGCATCNTHRRQMSFHARTFADFQHTLALLACSHELWENMPEPTNTASMGRYCTAGHLLDTLSSSWTLAGQPSPANNGSWTLTPFGILKI